MTDEPKHNLGPCALLTLTGRNLAPCVLPANHFGRCYPSASRRLARSARRRANENNEDEKDSAMPETTDDTPTLKTIQANFVTHADLGRSEQRMEDHLQNSLAMVERGLSSRMDDLACAKHAADTDQRALRHRLDKVGDLGCRVDTLELARVDSQALIGRVFALEQCQPGKLVPRLRDLEEAVFVSHTARLAQIERLEAAARLARLEGAVVALRSNQPKEVRVLGRPIELLANEEFRVDISTCLPEQTDDLGISNDDSATLKKRLDWVEAAHAAAEAAGRERAKRIEKLEVAICGGKPTGKGQPDARLDRMEEQARAAAARAEQAYSLAQHAYKKAGGEEAPSKPEKPTEPIKTMNDWITMPDASSNTVDFAGRQWRDASVNNVAKTDPPKIPGVITLGSGGVLYHLTERDSVPLATVAQSIVGAINELHHGLAGHERAWIEDERAAFRPRQRKRRVRAGRKAVRPGRKVWEKLTGAGPFVVLQEASIDAEHVIEAPDGARRIPVEDCVVVEDMQGARILKARASLTTLEPEAPLTIFEKSARVALLVARRLTWVRASTWLTLGLGAGLAGTAAYAVHLTNLLAVAGQ